MRAIKVLMVTLTVSASLLVGTSAASEPVDNAPTAKTLWCC